MTEKKWILRIVVAALASTLAACMGEDAFTRAAGSDMDGDMDSDSGSSGDADTDADSDADTDADSDTTPEEEERFDYRIPASSGEYVFIPDRAGDKVIIVHSETLQIQIVDVGSTPTHVVPLGDDGAVAALSVNADEVSIVAVDSEGRSSTAEVDVREDTNALVASDSGQIVIAFWDTLFQDESGAPETNQDISIIDLRGATPEVFDTIVGMNPLSVSYNTAVTRAFVITETGIDIIDLEDLSSAFIPDNVKLFDEPIIDPELVEIAIDPAGTVAIGRRNDSVDVSVAWLDGTDESRTYTLPSAPTDLDIAADGSFGMLTLRGLSQVAVFSLPFPTDPAADPFTYVALGGQICGTATLLPDGTGAALYTTVAGSEDDQRLLTILNHSNSNWTAETQLLSRRIKAVEAAPDSSSLFVLHEVDYYSDMPWSYSLVKLPKLQTKFQQLDTEPGQLLMTPSGEDAFLIVADGNGSVNRVETINLGSFIVDSLNLGSTPTSLGYTEETDKLFIAQSHPSGRMTFMDLADQSLKTVTGYVLNNEITN